MSSSIKNSQLIIKEEDWYLKDLDFAYSALKTSQNGLSNSEAISRLQQNGPNSIQEYKAKPAWLILAHQFSDFMIIVLFVAAAIAGLVGEIADSFVILAIILLNGIIGFIQEFNAEKAMIALKKMNALNSLVIRNNHLIPVPAANLVTGDIVVLEAGNIVPADLRLIEAAQLKIEEASLTGESHAVEKHSNSLHDAHLPINDRNNMAYKGTLIVNGRGLGLVVATGMNTEIGKIAFMLAEEEVSTPLQKRLKKFGKNLSFVIFIICILYFSFGLWRGEEVLSLLLTSVSLAIAAIPEALPAFVVIALAFGAKRMMKQKVLIRKLPSVETLGSVTYICSDKTGTLTENKMSVEEVCLNDMVLNKQDLIRFYNDDAFKLLFSAMALNNDVAWGENDSVIGDPTEVAIYNIAFEHNYHKNVLLKNFPRVAEIPFDSNRKCMTTIHKWENNYIIFTKGAVEAVISKCEISSNVLNEKYLMHSDKMAAEGLRVIGFGYRILSQLPEQITEEKIENNLIVVGICGMMDPPREEAKEAIKHCKTAGIHTVMITGDHLLTGKAIAKRLGIIESEDDMVVIGKQLSKMSEKELIDNVKKIKVYARVSPEQKLNIVKALQQNGQFVAMTGDGINDAPSLKSADIGVAMGITGTDVSKEAAHMILLDDNFATIVKAIREGRRIFDNIKKFIRYILTGNLAEVWAILLASILGLPIPLLPIHILWINLVTDGLPGLALAGEPAEKEIMNKPPRHPKESIFAGGLWFFILWVGFLTGAIATGIQYLGIQYNFHWQTMVFSTLCFSQLALVLTIRSESQSIFKLGLFSNIYVLLVVLFTLILQFATIYVPFFNSIFKTEPLTIIELAIVLAASLIVFVSVEINKFFITKQNRR